MACELQDPNAGKNQVERLKMKWFMIVLGQKIISKVTNRN